MSLDTFVSIINQLLPEPHASLLAGMLFGVRANMPKHFYQALRATGTLHIIALSGMNITIIIYVIGSIMCVISRRVSALLTIFFIFLFVWFVGPSANVVRAAIMGSLTLIGVYFGRQRFSLLSLLLTGIIMLSIKPAWLFDIGFQLSFFATLGIILLGGGGTFSRVAGVETANSGLVERIGLTMTVKEIRTSTVYKMFNTRFRLLDSLLMSFWVDLRTTLAAQLFTFPIIFYHFGQISLISPLTNVLVGWVVQPITILGLFAAIFGWLFLPLGQFLAWFIYPLLDYFIIVVDWTSQIPFASI